MDDDLEQSVRDAVKLFWTTRDRQSRPQGGRSRANDTGLRAAVTGGKHLDGFCDVCRRLCTQAGLDNANVFWKSKRELPGFFRAEKGWDLVVAADKMLVPVIEFKAQVGPSFGNNLNNRAEEAIGSATDLWAAYREGAFKPSARPWLGYIFILEDCPRSKAPVKTKSPHFAVFPEFETFSYAKRHEILLTKLLRERLYDGACLLLSSPKQGKRETRRLSLSL